MTVDVADWVARAERLADQLTADGDLRSPHWRRALCAVPRHEFVPRYYVQDGLPASADWRLIEPRDEDGRQRWLDVVYSDTTMVTAIADVADRGVQVAVSSSTKPDLMIRMLEELDVHDGHRVLEIGTGTGYNAALLTERIGEENVFSIDVDAGLVNAARDRLARLGHRPTLLAANGSAGLPQHGPYDRIIATCSVSRVPTSWLDQVSPGGLILVDVEGAMSAGNLVALRRGAGPTATGHLLPWWGRFMRIRDGGSVGAPLPRRDTRTSGARTTTVDPAALDGSFRFLAQLHLPSDVSLSLSVEDGRPWASCLLTEDGSWCEVGRRSDDHGRFRVDHGGARDLWRAVENAWVQWELLDAPQWHRFGLTVTQRRQTVWLDYPSSGPRWEL